MDHITHRRNISSYKQAEASGLQLWLRKHVGKKKKHREGVFLSWGKNSSFAKKKEKKKWTSCIQLCFVPSLVESGSVVFEKNLKSPYYYYLSLERELSFIWINFCRIFVFPYRNYLPVSKSNALHFNKIKFSLLKDAVCQVRLILVNWFLRRSQKM